jgi:N-acyl-D-amino-acid deacylase
VIEVVTGENYNDYVRRTILQPAAMTNTMPGKTRLDDRVDGEVRYHMQKQTSAPAFWSIVSRSLRSNSGKLPNSVPSQYGQWDLEIMDAHGGWLSTAPDLLRFVIAAHSSEAGLLSQTSQQTMLERPDLPDNPGSGFWYGCGWQVRPVGGYGFNIWHSGALDGTSALLVRRWDNMTWAVLFNTDRSTNGEFLASLIDPRLHHAISQVDQLPEYNLFTAEENPGSQD